VGTQVYMHIPYFRGGAVAGRYRVYLSSQCLHNVFVCIENL